VDSRIPNVAMLSKFGVGTLASYTGLDQVGEGTYGYVYKAKDQRTGETVALKRLFLRLQREVIYLTCLRNDTDCFFTKKTWGSHSTLSAS
jgi:serine/threonine protein kinase